MAQTRRWPFLQMAVLALIGLWILVPVIGWKMLTDGWDQGRLPPGVEAPEITYSKFGPPGLGPGGNDVGLIVYRMSERSARQVERGGVGYLIEMAAMFPSHSDYVYSDWRATPVLLDDRWTRKGETRCVHPPSFGSVVEYSGFSCKVDPALIKRIDRIVFAPGAYYASGTASSLIIVAPKERMVVIAYNG